MANLWTQKKRGKIENMLYSLDSNAVSDILRRRLDVLTSYRAEAKRNNIGFAICDIAYYEVVRGLEAIGASSKIREFMKMYEEMEHLSLDIAAINKSIDIYVNLHKGQQIEDAMVNNCTLVTANEKHFGRIEGLSCVNWRN